MFFVMSMGETADLKDGNHSRTVDGVQGKRNSAHETSCGSVPQAPASSSRRPSPPSCAAEDPGREPRAQRHSSDAGSAAAAAAADCANGAQAPGSAAAPAPGCAPSRSSPEPMTAARRTPELGPDTARKKLEPVPGSTQGSPTLQITHVSRENIKCPSPTPSSPSQSPQLGVPSEASSAPVGGGPPVLGLCSGSEPSLGSSWRSSSSEVQDGVQPPQFLLGLAESQGSLDRASDSSGGRSQAPASTDGAVVVLRPSPDPMGGPKERLDPMCRSFDRSDPLNKSDKSSKLLEKKKKTSSWYNMLNPTYKSRSEDFKKLFRDLPETERLIVDYSCALQRDILVHGRLYVTQNFICFYANIFRWETNVVIRCRDVTSMTKEKTARVIPNAVQVCTDHEKHFFTSFGARDKTYLMLFRIWQNALMEQPMSTQELWQWVHYSYGDELGLTSDDDDYVAPPYLEDEPRGTRGTARLVCLPGIDKVGVEEPLGPGCNPFEALQREVDCLEENDQSGDGEPPIFATPREPKLHHSDLPTDLSDTTEFEGDSSECPCPAPSHEGKEMLNLVLSMSVDQLFSLLFTGSRFFHDLLTSRKTYDVTESNWQPCPETGHKLRQLTYTVTLNHAMAKAAHSTETQILLKQSRPGQVYAIDCDVQSTGIPYSDAFCVKSHYCLSRISDSRCRLRIFACIRYKKSVWGLVKSVIEKNSLQGVAGFCNDLEGALLTEAERLQPASAQGHKQRRRRLRDSQHDQGQRDRSSSSQACFPRFGSARIHLGESRRSCLPTSATLKALLFLVVLVLLINMTLLYKLWVPGDRPFFRGVDILVLEPVPTNQEEWVRLLSKRESLRRLEADTWGRTVEDLLQTVRSAERSLLELKKSLQARSLSEFPGQPPPADTAPKSQVAATGEL